MPDRKSDVALIDCRISHQRWAFV